MLVPENDTPGPFRRRNTYSAVWEIAEKIHKSREHKKSADGCGPTDAEDMVAVGILIHAKVPIDAPPAATHITRPKAGPA